MNKKSHSLGFLFYFEEYCMKNERAKSGRVSSKCNMICDMNFRPNPFTSNWDDHQWAIISQTGTFDEANHPPRKGLYFNAKPFLEATNTTQGFLLNPKVSGLYCNSCREFYEGQLYFDEIHL